MTFSFAALLVGIAMAAFAAGLAIAAVAFFAAIGFTLSHFSPWLPRDTREK